MRDGRTLAQRTQGTEQSYFIQSVILHIYIYMLLGFSLSGRREFQHDDVIIYVAMRNRKITRA